MNSRVFALMKISCSLLSQYSLITGRMMLGTMPNSINSNVSTKR